MSAICAYCSSKLHGEVIAMQGLFYCNYNHARRDLMHTKDYNNDVAYSEVGETAEKINIDELEEKEMNGLSIGDKCFIHGCIAEIVGSTKECFNILINGIYPMYKANNNGAKELRRLVDERFDRVDVNDITGYRSVKQFNPITAYSVPKNECEPIITDVFDIGSHIETTLAGGGLVGKVIAFEYHNNKATCISDKIKAYQNDRTRYSYKYNELALYEQPKEIQFNLGQMYLVDSEPMQVIQTSTNCLGLVDGSFTVRHCNIPKNTTDKNLMKTFKIKSIEYMPQDIKIDKARDCGDQITFAIIF